MGNPPRISSRKSLHCSFFASSSVLPIVWCFFKGVFKSILSIISSRWIKVSSRVKKNHHFSKFAIFKRLNIAHQEFSFKKKFQEKVFFCADL